MIIWLIVVCVPKQTISSVARYLPGHHDEPKEESFQETPSHIISQAAPKPHNNSNSTSRAGSILLQNEVKPATTQDNDEEDSTKGTPFEEDAQSLNSLTSSQKNLETSRQATITNSELSLDVTDPNKTVLEVANDSPRELNSTVKIQVENQQEEDESTKNSGEDKTKNVEEPKTKNSSMETSNSSFTHINEVDDSTSNDNDEVGKDDVNSDQK